MNAQEECREIIDDLLHLGYSHQVREKDLKLIIMRRRGIDPRTIKKWINALVTFEYIKQISPTVYQLNPTVAPVCKALKKKPQTKIS